MHVRGRRALRFYAVYHDRRYRVFCQTIAVCHLALAVFEAPSSSNRDFRPAIDCGRYEKNVLAAIELAFLATYALDLYIKRVAVGPLQWRRRKWTWAKGTAVAVLLGNVLVSLCAPRPYMYFKFLRPVFLVEKARNVRAMMVNMLSTVAAISDVAALLAAHVMFSSVPVSSFLPRTQHCRTHSTFSGAVLT